MKWSVTFTLKSDPKHAFGWEQKHKPTNKELKEARMFYGCPEETWEVTYGNSQ